MIALVWVVDIILVYLLEDKTLFKVDRYKKNEEVAICLSQQEILIILAPLAITALVATMEHHQTVRESSLQVRKILY